MTEELVTMQVVNLPSAAATPGPFQGALDVDEPVPVLYPVCREDTNIGHVQRNLNDVVHSDSHREPGPRSSHKGALPFHYTCNPSRHSGRTALFSFMSFTP
jgi:hypothetical protein